MSNGVKKILIILMFIPMTAGISGCIKKSNMPEEIIFTKKAVLIIAGQGFQDFEYSETRKALTQAGIETIIASSIKSEARGKSGEKVKVDKIIEEINPEDFDALILIGGPGALEYVDNPVIHQLIRQIVEQKKLLGAICIAPEILAEAGVLKGKKATVWSSSIDRSPIKFLTENGAEYLDQDVVIDGNIITANGPSAASIFGQKIVEFLNQ